MQERTSQGPCQKGLSRAEKKPGIKSAQIISMQRWTDSLYSSPPSSLSSSTPSTGDTSCSVTSYSASNKVISGGTVKWCQVKNKRKGQESESFWIIHVTSYQAYSPLKAKFLKQTIRLDTVEKSWQESTLFDLVHQWESSGFLLIPVDIRILHTLLHFPGNT